MQKEPLGLGHKGLLFDRLRAVHVPISEFSFPNLYLFREAHRYEVLTTDGGEVFMKGLGYDGHAYLMPTRDIRETGAALLRDALSSGEAEYLYPVPEEWAAGLDPGEFASESRDGESDYIYTVEKLRDYPGRRLHRKRNLVKLFTETYSHEALPLTDDRLPDARLVLEEWQREAKEPPEESDYGPCVEALALYDELRLCGGIFYAEGEPAGFVLGEELSDETFVLHFAKARVKFKGVYQYMFSRFAEVLPEKYRLINFEQDMDRPALRAAKSSYQPDMMLRKLRVGLRG